MRLVLALLISACFLAIVPAAMAHEVRPAYLEIKEIAAGTYDVLWKVPALGNERRLGIYVRFPADVTVLSEPRGMFSQNAFIERWRVQRAGGLADQAIQIDGLAATKIDVLARVEHAHGATQTTRILPGLPSFVVQRVQTSWQVSSNYLWLGVEHILLGIDHLLYVLSMLLIVSGWKRIVATMTAFTFTHSLTLSAAALGFVHVPGPPVEALIALSIVFVAREIVLTHRGEASLTQRLPWVISFTFGLLHGLGFAGALSEVGLPAHAIPFALLSFNIGVEIGQLVFISAMLGILAIARRVSIPTLTAGLRVAPYATGSVAMFWVIKRVAAF